MKILHVITSLDGGPSKILGSIVKSKQNNHDNFVIVTNYEIFNDELLKVLLNLNIKEKLITKNEKFQVLPLILIIKTILFEKPNIIISYDNYSNFLCSVKFLFNNKIKFFCSVHGLIGVFKPWKIIIQRFVYRIANNIIVPSKIVKKKIIKKKIINEKKVIIIPNGIKINFKFNNRKKIDSIINVVCLANFYSKIKGQEYLIKASKFLPKNFKINFIGDGKYLNYAKNMTKRLKLCEQINFKGAQDSKTVRNSLYHYDVMVIPSLSETFCIAALESMAAGVPVIASEVGGLMEIFDKNKDGILVKEGNPRLIAQHLVNLCEDSLLYNFIRKNAYNKVKTKYNEFIMVSNYINLFEKT